MKVPRDQRAFALHRTAAALAIGFCMGAGSSHAQQGTGAASEPPVQEREGAAPVVPSSAAFRSRTPVTVNFVNSDIEAVSRTFAAMLGRQIFVDPRVKGVITVYSDVPLSVREAYLTYLAALRGAGFTVVETAGLLKVIPEADAKLQTGTVAIGETTRRGDQVLTQIFRLNHENVNSLIPVLRPLISPNNTINANISNNTLVITDYASNLQRLARIIAVMDTPAASDIEVIALKHAVASDIAPLVQRLSDPGSPVAGVPVVPQVAGAALAGSGSVLADVRSNSLIVRATNPARLAAIRAVVDKLDRPMQGGGPAGNIWVVYLRNADATRLATVLRAAFAQAGSGAAGGAGTTPAFTTPTSTPSALTTAGQAGTAGGLSPQATAPITPTAAPSTGGFIQADPATNSLVITAPEPVYRQLRAVIDQLDSRRAQIFIESMIVKVDANKAAELGVQWQNLFGEKGDKWLPGIGTNFSTAGNNIITLSAIAAGGRAAATQFLQQGGSIASGLNIGVLRQIGSFYTLGAIAHFLENNTDANVLSTPNLIALDNEEAKFVNGQNVPFVTGQFTNTGAVGGAVNPFQTIERKDVGLTLRVRPQVGEGGKVRMTIFQENSSVNSNTTSGLITDKSSIETTVEIEDGSIVVLGGLLRDEYTHAKDKVPLLGDIPYLGALFRSERRDRKKTNLMVFLRPIVLRTPDAAEALTLDRYEQIRAVQIDAQPKRSPVLPINEAPVLPAVPAPAPREVAPPLPLVEPERQP